VHSECLEKHVKYHVIRSEPQQTQMVWNIVLTCVCLFLTFKGTQFNLEGLWEQFTNQDVYFKLLAKDQQGNPKDPGNRLKIEAVLQGQENYQVYSQ
jgi:hypothetical protein